MNFEFLTGSNSAEVISNSGPDKYWREKIKHFICETLAKLRIVIEKYFGGEINKR